MNVCCFGRRKFGALIRLLLILGGVAIYQVYTDFRAVNQRLAESLGFDVDAPAYTLEFVSNRIGAAIGGSTGTASSTSSSSSSSSPQQHHPDIDKDLVQKTRDFLEARKQAYKDVGYFVNWHLRGIAYLYQHQDVLMAGEVKLPAKDSASQKGQVFLYNVHLSVEILFQRISLGL